jgi:succinyldiaminopimelate transaminase
VPRQPLELPDFPWDALESLKARAQTHPDGIVDLSVGSPVDPTPDAVQRVLASATDAHGYPATAGSPALREAILDWLTRRRGAQNASVANVIPTIGSKEAIALLPLLLGVRAGQAVVIPTLAYPTYEIAAKLVGARIVRADDPADWPEDTALAFLNSPGNPHGATLGIDQLKAAVARARELDAVVVNDECYAELTWDSDGGTTAEPSVSILDGRVVGEVRSRVLAVYSLSKQSNLAGYRAGVLAGCSELVGEILAVRKHLGLIPPAPVQAAMIEALRDDAAVQEQRERYRRRRTVLKTALEGAGYRIDESGAGLYLWATRGEDCWVTLEALAELGILAAPGSFYGEDPAVHVRIALTASDADIEAAAARIGLAS